MDREEIKKILLEILEDQYLDTEGITEDTSFVDDIQTFDSLDKVECWLRTEKEFGISIPEEEVEKVVKVKDAIDIIQKYL